MFKIFQLMSRKFLYHILFYLFVQIFLASAIFILAYEHCLLCFSLTAVEFVQEKKSLS